MPDEFVTPCINKDRLTLPYPVETYLNESQLLKNGPRDPYQQSAFCTKSIFKATIIKLASSLPEIV